jgi:ferrochelatase
VKRAVILFNLGGPDSPEAVEPFLRNLFSDPAVISLPALLRKPLAQWIARRRAPIAREIYAKIGGRSPILEETQAQACALEAALTDRETRVFIAMRCWKPFSDTTVRNVAAWAPDSVVLLPLYPQYSTTTTGSSLRDWRRAAYDAGVRAWTSAVCCYPQLPGFIEALAANARLTAAKTQAGVSYRWLLSAHGLPKRVIARGDPYQWQVEQTAAALAAHLELTDFTICYQSRVGPLEWIGPGTDAEIRRAGAEGKGVIVVPIAFVSEHSETLVELDILYAELARDAGVRDYLRVPTVGVRAEFIAGLAGLVVEAAAGRRCPAGFSCCGFSQDE